MMQSVRERWRQMSQRERTLVLAGGIVLGLSLLFILIIDPLLDTLDRLGRQEVRKQKELAELTVLGQAYLAKRERLTKTESRMPGADSHFSLLTFMEEAATTAHVRERITSMQPQVQSLAQGYEETAVDGIVHATNLVGRDPVLGDEVVDDRIRDPDHAGGLAI